MQKEQEIERWKRNDHGTCDCIDFHLIVRPSRRSRSRCQWQWETGQANGSAWSTPSCKRHSFCTHLGAIVNHRLGYFIWNVSHIYVYNVWWTKRYEHAPRFSNYCGYVNLESCELKNVQHHFETGRSIPWELFMSSPPSPATLSLFWLTLISSWTWSNDSIDRSVAHTMVSMR